MVSVLLKRSDCLIRSACHQDMSGCFSLEQCLSEKRPRALKEGFLLSGSDSVETYRSFQKLGCFWVAECSGAIVGFLFALPPDCEHMKKLLRLRDRCELHAGYEDVFTREPLAWLAKAGIVPEQMRRGIASQLYRKLFEEHPDWNFLTTTVKKPIYNGPSVRLQRKFEFESIGSLKLEDRGELAGIVCKVHFREARALP